MVRNWSCVLITLSMVVALVTPSLVQDLQKANDVACDKFESAVVLDLSRNYKDITSSVAENARIYHNGNKVAYKTFYRAAVQGKYRVLGPTRETLDSGGDLLYNNWKANGYSAAVSFSRSAKMITEVTIVNEVNDKS